jgi:hypothetical protein
MLHSSDNRGAWTRCEARTSPTIAPAPGGVPRRFRPPVETLFPERQRGRPVGRARTCSPEEKVGGNLLWLWLSSRNEI